MTNELFYFEWFIDKLVVILYDKFNYFDYLMISINCDILLFNFINYDREIMRNNYS